MIVYQTTLAGITPAMLTEFFVDWPNPPSPETHLRILAGSHSIVLAIDDETSRVIGFINAISDGVLTAYIPLLEVLPAYQSLGIGSDLVRRMVEQLRDLYAIDLLCDDDVVPFYEQLGFMGGTGMSRRNYEHQSGQP